ncbi:MAG: DUF2834 domain-containing protein [Leptospiraceae bacterium]|nr:DUF2834 domain-containing protein [Leptospiraceae bacterium]MCB1304753.1 DUF2834 domain-containing protein [Leptospiraceae bacterium]
MHSRVFRLILILIASAFTAFFFFYVVPPAMASGDMVGAIMGGFVNPFAAGYSTDVILCWVVLTAWVLYEGKSVQHGWVCILLGIVPGVAVGLSVFLLLKFFPRAQT